MSEELEKKLKSLSDAEWFDLVASKLEHKDLSPEEYEIVQAAMERLKQKHRELNQKEKDPFSQIVKELGKKAKGKLVILSDDLKHFINEQRDQYPKKRLKKIEYKKKKEELKEEYKK